MAGIASMNFVKVSDSTWATESTDGNITGFYRKYILFKVVT